MAAIYEESETFRSIFHSYCLIVINDSQDETIEEKKEQVKGTTQATFNKNLGHHHQQIVVDFAVACSKEEQISEKRRQQQQEQEKQHEEMV